jgi:hypothetical protein
MRYMGHVSFKRNLKCIQDFGRKGIFHLGYQGVDGWIILGWDMRERERERECVCEAMECVLLGQDSD